LKGHHRRAALLIACALGLALFPGTARHMDPMPWSTAPDLRSYAFHGESMKEEEEEGPSSYPSDWQWLRRTAPLWKADPDAFRETTNRARRLRNEASGNQLLTQALVQAGPSNVGGRISDIEWDPVVPSIIYAGSATGGVYKTTDTGANWFPVGDDVPNLNVGDLAIDPSAHNTVWLGTGEANGGHNNFPGGGVYRTTDGGASWSLMGLENSASIGRRAATSDPIPNAASIAPPTAARPGRGCCS
jgi:hypothetical protein